MLDMKKKISGCFAGSTSSCTKSLNEKSIHLAYGYNEKRPPVFNSLITRGENTAMSV